MSTNRTSYPAPGIAPDVFYDPDSCPIRDILGFLGQKWPSLILCHLAFGTHRFSELRGAIPDISQRMLTQTLRKLERDGLVDRDMKPNVPPHVEYSLTKTGQSFIAPLQGMMLWGVRNKDRVNLMRRAYDAEMSEPYTPTKFKAAV